MGVIQDGYYYPKPEEVTLGYICEINDALGYKVEYVPTVISLKNEEGFYWDQIADVTQMMDDRYGEVRVPLLSKADIESLGWHHIGGFYYEWSVKDRLYCDEISNRCLDWRLNWVKPGRYLKIECYERNAFEWETAFMGPCPTINHLKFLMELLKVVPLNQSHPRE